MSANFISKSEITIQAPASSVWQVITSPDTIRAFMFGTQVQTDWKIGSDITWTGTHQGKTYRDKGKVLQVLPEKMLQHTYYSSMTEIEDKPENYFNVTYELEESDGATTLVVTNSNLPDEQSREHSRQNWQSVLEKIKELAERKEVAETKQSTL
jgi:uncharacterized protein YndB with AHSA1/START domain